jgi:hypothetical protein
MLIAVLDERQRVVVVFDTDVHIDEGATGPEMSVETHKEIFERGGSFGDWIYEGGQFRFDIEPLPKNTTAPSSGEIPTEVL